MQIFTNYFNNFGYYFLHLPANEDTNLKNGDDTYEVYVNEEFVGYKVLESECEKPSDVINYLSNNGFENVKYKIIGNRIMINEIIDYKARELVNVAGIYLNNK